MYSYKQKYFFLPKATFLSTIFFFHYIFFSKQELILIYNFLNPLEWKGHEMKCNKLIYFKVFFITIKNHFF